MKGVDKIKRLILNKLLRSNMWGCKHTPLDFVRKGIPEHYRNSHKGKKTLEKALKELVNSEWIFILPNLEIPKIAKSAIDITMRL